jgi:hypothetical protein
MPRTIFLKRSPLWSPAYPAINDKSGDVAISLFVGFSG